MNNFFGKHLNRLDRYSDSNLELITTNEFSNIWFDKAYNYRTNLSAIKDEQLEHYILEILRLTEREN